MRWLLIYLFFSFQICFAKDQSTRAIQHIQKAAYTYPVIKGYTKSFEKEFFEYLPVSKEYAGYFGSIAMTAVTGQVNTRKFKNININFFGGYMRPDLVYDLRTKETSGLVVINWHF
jgi:hypothetical protein